MYIWIILPWYFTTALVQECNNVAAVVILKVSVILLTFLSYAVLVVGCIAVFLTSTYWMPGICPVSHSWLQKHLQALPSDTVYFSVTPQFTMHGPGDSSAPISRAKSPSILRLHHSLGPRSSLWDAQHSAREAERIMWEPSPEAASIIPPTCPTYLQRRLGNVVYLCL